VAGVFELGTEGTVLQRKGGLVVAGVKADAAPDVEVDVAAVGEAEDGPFTESHFGSVERKV
jgi:hypothetical protein